MHTTMHTTMAIVTLVAKSNARAPWYSWRSSSVLYGKLDDSDGRNHTVEAPLDNEEQLMAFVSGWIPSDPTDWGAFLRTDDALGVGWVFDEYAKLLLAFVDACDLKGMRDFMKPDDEMMDPEPEEAPVLWASKRTPQLPVAVVGDLGLLSDSVWVSLATRLGFVGTWMLVLVSSGAHRALWGRVQEAAREIQMTRDARELKFLTQDITRCAVWVCGKSWKGDQDTVDPLGLARASWDLADSVESLRRAYNETAVARVVLRG